MQYRRPACAVHADRSQVKGATFFFTPARERTYNPKGSLLLAEGGTGGFRPPCKSFDRAQVWSRHKTINYHFNEIFKSVESAENSVIRKSCRFG